MKKTIEKQHINDFFMDRKEEARKQQRLKQRRRKDKKENKKIRQGCKSNKTGFTNRLNKTESILLSKSQMTNYLNSNSGFRDLFIIKLSSPCLIKTLTAC